MFFIAHLLNALTQLRYIEWASHEYQDREYDFKTLNITHYCLIAQKLDLNVILRLGPFIASERDGVNYRL